MVGFFDYFGYGFTNLDIQSKCVLAQKVTYIRNHGRKVIIPALQRKSLHMKYITTLKNDVVHCFYVIPRSKSLIISLYFSSINFIGHHGYVNLVHVITFTGSSVTNLKKIMS